MDQPEIGLNRRRFAVACGGAIGAAALPAALYAQQQNRIVVENPLLMLVRDAKVHKELNLQPRQVAAIQNATDKIDPAFFLMRDLSAADRAAKSQPLVTRVQAALDQILEGIQKKRFQQLIAQSQGHRALLRDDIARTMQFTGSQRSQYDDIAQETEKEKAKLYEKAKSGTAREKVQQEITELMNDEQKKFVAVMTAPQKRMIASVFGAAFERNRNQLPHFKPPKLPLAGPWVNSEPLSLERLKGKVVALHFYAFA